MPGRTYHSHAVSNKIIELSKEEAEVAKEVAEAFLQDYGSKQTTDPPDINEYFDWIDEHIEKELCPLCGRELFIDKFLWWTADCLAEPEDCPFGRTNRYETKQELLNALDNSKRRKV